MEGFNVEIIDIEEYFPPGVKRIIGQGTSCFVGLLYEKTVLKYPCLPNQSQLALLDVERKIMEHIGQHARVIRLEGFRADGLLLEYAVNGTLHDFILKQQGSALSLTERIRFCIQIAQGIVHLHSKRVFHGDIRPGNILLDANLDIKLADIQGMLKSSAKEDGEEVLLDGLARESCMYFKPREGDDLNVGTDLFAFGSTIHFIMTGGQEVFPDLVPAECCLDGEYRQLEDLEDEVYRRFVNMAFPDDFHLCSEVEQRCWRGGYASAAECLRDLELLAPTVAE